MALTKMAGSCLLIQFRLYLGQDDFCTPEGIAFVQSGRAVIEVYPLRAGGRARSLVRL